MRSTASRAAGLAVSLALLAAAACGSGDGDGDGSGSGSGEGGAAADERCTEDRRGGELTMGVGVAARGLDPTVALGTGIAGATEMTAIYDTLMRYDVDTGEFVPHVAESLEPDDDMTTWTLVLRDGVAFGNGDPLTAEAVRFSVERMAGSEVAHAGLAQEVDSMDVVDERTLVFHLRQPWGSLPYFLAGEGGMVTNPAVVEAAGDEAFNTDPAGAGVGPYEPVRFAPGEEIVLEARDDYWGGPVCIGTLRFVLVPGGEATYEAFQAGELDMAFLTEAPAVARARDDGTDGYLNIGGGGTTLFINSGRGPDPVGADVRIRRAVAAALDLDLINERAFDGTGLPSSAVVWEDQRISPGLDGPAYDPDEARDLVEQARADGWDGRIGLACGDTPTLVELSITVEALLTDVGFTVERENLPAEEHQQRVLFDGDYDLACTGISVFDAGPFARLNQFHSESVRNRVGYGDPDMDAAIDRLTRAASEEETAEALAEVQEVWNETVPAANAFATQYFLGHAERVHGLLYTRDTTVMFQTAYVE